MCKKYILLLLLTIALSNNGQSNRFINLSNSQNNLNTECFSIPQIPIILQSNTEKLNFLALHWWDNFAFNNTDCTQNTRMVEKAFLDFINICSSVDEKLKIIAAHKLMKSTTADTSGKMYKHFLQLAEKYLYDPNSPLEMKKCTLYTLTIY